MTLFEYLGILISVVMGLGITHLLIGVSKTIHLRNTLRIYWVHSVWTVNLLVFIIVIWWGMFWWSSLEQWAFFQFLFIIITPGSRCGLAVRFRALVPSLNPDSDPALRDLAGR